MGDVNNEFWQNIESGKEQEHPVVYYYLYNSLLMLRNSEMDDAERNLESDFNHLNLSRSKSTRMLQVYGKSGGRGRNEIASEQVILRVVFVAYDRFNSDQT